METDITGLKLIKEETADAINCFMSSHIFWLVITHVCTHEHSSMWLVPMVHHYKKVNIFHNLAHRYNVGIYILVLVDHYCWYL